MRESDLRQVAEISQEVLYVVMLPKGVLQELGRVIAPSKSVEYKEIRKRFIMHGYGDQKIEKWMKYFYDNEIITENEDHTYSCIWW